MKLNLLDRKKAWLYNYASFKIMTDALFSFWEIDY
mgnify:CR=1 FL=1